MPGPYLDYFCNGLFSSLTSDIVFDYYSAFKLFLFLRYKFFPMLFLMGEDATTELCIA